MKVLSSIRDMLTEEDKSYLMPSVTFEEELANPVQAYADPEVESLRTFYAHLPGDNRDHPKMSKNPYWDTPSGVLQHKLKDGSLTDQEAVWAKEVLSTWMNDGYGPPKHWLDD